jgi:hypothetical protein
MTSNEPDTEVGRESAPSYMALWFFHRLPHVWGRWASARLTATAACSGWLHELNPVFTRRQRFLRSTLHIALFVLPIPLVVRMKAVHPKHS